MSEKPKSKVEVEDVVINIFYGFVEYLKIAWRGFSDQRNSIIDGLVVIYFLYELTYSRFYKIHWSFLQNQFHFKSPVGLIWTTALVRSFLLALFCWITVYFVIGLWKYILILKAQKEFDKIGLKNAKGECPKITNIFYPNPFKEILQITPNGIGLTEFNEKLDNFVVSFKKNVTKIALTDSKEFVEIHLNSKNLERLFNYETCKDLILKPYSFIIGESTDAILTKNILDLPHLLVAGTSGGGKSNFFRQTLVSLLKSSPNVQMYLLDLKQGVEVVEFGDLPNVVIADNIPDSVRILENLELEMVKRLNYLRERRKKFIVPARDKFDLIVLGIDEASELFGKERADSPDRKMIDEARRFGDKLAKKARAVGIHLIVATQKPVKEAIDSKFMENLQGRMVFKMMSLSGSNVALGNKKAQDLDSIRGRAIWQDGTEEVEVQTPMITDNEVNAEIQAILKDFKESKRSQFNEMFSLAAKNNSSIDLDSKNQTVPSKKKKDIE